MSETSQDGGIVLKTGSREDYIAYVATKKIQDIPTGTTSAHASPPLRQAGTPATLSLVPPRTRPQSV